MKNKTLDENFLRKNGLKPTRQRLLLSKILFSSGDKHFTAEEIRRIANKKGSKKCHCIYKFYDKFITCMYRAECILRMLLGLYQDRRLYLHMSLKNVWVFCVHLIF